MKKGIIYPVGRITTNFATEDISIEQQMRKARSNKEPIQATAKITYNDRKDGVLPQHDIRTDRFEIAMNATDKIHATKAATRRGVDAYEDAINKGKTAEEAQQAYTQASGMPYTEG